jgi:AcrR family transcriptional regulator
MESQKDRRPYRSTARDSQAQDTRTKIAESASNLFISKGFQGTTIDAIAKGAGVAPQTVYAVFGSKAGVLAELLDRSSFDAEYQELTRQAREKSHPPERLRFAARIARHIYDSQMKLIELFQGASLVAPELAKVIEEREAMRFTRQKNMIDFIRQAGWLNPDIGAQKARDILWALTSRDLYSMMVLKQKWSSKEYEDWLAGVLSESLLRKPEMPKSRVKKRD